MADDKKKEVEKEEEKENSWAEKKFAGMPILKKPEPARPVR
jgi:hypothetical protein